MAVPSIVVKEITSQSAVKTESVSATPAIKATVGAA